MKRFLQSFRWCITNNLYIPHKLKLFPTTTEWRCCAGRRGRWEGERGRKKSWKMRTNILGRSGCVRGAHRDVKAPLVHWFQPSFPPRGQPPDRTSVPGFPLTLLACLWISASAGLAPVWTRLNSRRHGHERYGITDGVASMLPVSLSAARRVKSGGKKCN